MSKKILWLKQKTFDSKEDVDQKEGFDEQTRWFKNTRFGPKKDSD